MRNWQNGSSSTSYGVDWRRFLPRSLSVDNLRDDELLESYLRKHFYDLHKVADFKQWMARNVDSDQIVDDLEVLMGKPFLQGPITAVITTFHRAPYDVNARLFYLILRATKRGHSITSIYHEMMHFFLHWHYWDACRAAGLSEQQTHVFKESLTVLLNKTLNKRGLPPDNGYPAHRMWRQRWIEVWREAPEFKSFFADALAEYASRVSTA
jgi:hypothetical protein